MARHTFGGAASDLLISPPSNHANALVALPSATGGTAWTAVSGGTRLADLVAVSGGTPVCTDSNGYVYQFQGPDGVTDLWVDFGSGTRYHLLSTDSLGSLAVLTVDGNAPNAAGNIVLSGTYAPITSAAADSVHAWGHSYVSGVLAGGGAYSESFPPAVAELLGLPLRNDGIGGVELYSYGPAGGWVPPLSKLTRPAYNRFTGPNGLHVCMWGINDLNALGNTSADMAPFQAALRTVLSRMRAGAVFPATDASVALAGSGVWSDLANTPPTYGAPGDLKYNASVGATIAITTPAAFPGGMIALGFTSWTDGGGATISGTVNGTVYSINTASVSLSGQSVGQVLRIPNVPAGSATYTFTVTAIVGAIGCLFNYWQWEAPDGSAPVIALVNQPKPLDYTAYGSTAPGPPTDAGVDVLNAIHASVAAEFGSRVVVVDTSGIDHDSTCFVAGNVHPTIKGHRYIAEQILTALQAVAVRYQPSVVWNVPRVEYDTAAPTAASTTYYPGDRIVNTAPAETGTAGSKYVVTGWMCVAQGQPGTWVQQRALTGN